MLPLPVTVTTKIMILLVGDPGSLFTFPSHCCWMGEHAKRYVLKSIPATSGFIHHFTNQQKTRKYQESSPSATPPFWCFYPPLLGENVCSPGISRRLVRCFSCGRVACSWGKNGASSRSRDFLWGNLIYWKFLPGFVFFVPESIVMVDGCCPDLFGTPHFTWQSP